MLKSERLELTWDPPLDPTLFDDWTSFGIALLAKREASFKEDGLFTRQLFSGGEISMAELSVFNEFSVSRDEGNVEETIVPFFT